jgi:hypothetical protein
LNKKQKAEISAFYDLYKKEKGEKMFYKFKCEKCGKVEEKEKPWHERIIIKSVDNKLN